LSHIHIPDGVLPLWLVLAGWALTALGVGLAAYRLRNETSRGVPLLGVMAAVMLVSMSTEIVPIAYHVNLSVLAGIVLGPAYGFLAGLIVNLILAMFGHGGITVVGLNTLVIGTETILGHFAFRALFGLIGRARRTGAPALAAGLATGLTLFVSTWLLIGIVWASNVAPGQARDTGALNPATLTFANPFQNGLVANRVVTPEKEVAASDAPNINLTRFIAAVLVLGLIGWVLEALITGAIVGFIDQIRPDLIRGRAARPRVSSAPTLVGPESTRNGN